MTDSTKVLEMALELIQDGWVQGDENIDSSVGRYCAVTALSSSAISLFHTADEVLSDQSRWAYRDAKTRLSRLLDTDIATWNDSPTTTKEDVILAFKRAINERPL